MKQDKPDNPDGSRDVEQLRHNNGSSGIGDDDVSGGEMTLTCLLTKMCNLAKYEASQTPKLNQKVGRNLTCI